MSSIGRCIDTPVPPPADLSKLLVDRRPSSKAFDPLEIDPVCSNARQLEEPLMTVGRDPNPTPTIARWHGLWGRQSSRVGDTPPAPSSRSNGGGL